MQYEPIQVWTILSSKSSSPCLYAIECESRNISTRDNYLFTNSEAMKMQEKTLFEETSENWMHLLKNYAAEAELFAKNPKALLPPDTPNFVKQVLKGSVVSEEVKLEEKTMVKGSLICPGCVVGKKVKVVNSAIHSGAVIGDECLIISCIVGADAKVDNGTSLKDQIIGSKRKEEEEENESEDDDEAND
eukprot:TRINITY_DN5972_c0_g1_i1.p1 TRINITY_DN5972_c0_g1~~TRINITY_DN5972_c0_g1_i1.p1  ORF type:complete len:189 (+),score=71.04 TRINITY_DN5972_c0_g1_i1:1071-1637(+)